MVNIEDVLAAPYSSAAVANAVLAAAAAVRAPTVDAPLDAPYFSYAVKAAVRAASAAVRASTVATPYSSFLAAVRRAWRPRREWRVVGPTTAEAAVRAYVSSSSAANSRHNRFAILALLADDEEFSHLSGMTSTNTAASFANPPLAILALLDDDGEFSHLWGMTSTNTAASFANPPIFDDFDINLPSTDASPKKTLFENGEASATTFINKLGKVTPEFVDEQKGPEGVQVTGEDDDGYAVVRSRKYGMLRGKYPEGPHVDSSVNVCDNEVPWLTIIGPRRKVRKVYQARKGGEVMNFKGLGFFVFGSYGPDGLEF